jgi:hypothetical protein
MHTVLLVECFGIAAIKPQTVEFLEELELAKTLHYLA